MSSDQYEQIAYSKYLNRKLSRMQSDLRQSNMLTPILFNTAAEKDVILRRFHG